MPICCEFGGDVEFVGPVTLEHGEVVALENLAGCIIRWLCEHVGSAEGKLVGAKHSRAKEKCNRSHLLFVICIHGISLAHAASFNHRSLLFVALSWLQAHRRVRSVTDQVASGVSAHKLRGVVD